MKIKTFSFKKSFFSMWDISKDKVQQEIQTWLSSQPSIDIIEIKHDSFAAVWYPAQLVVSIYYKDQ